MTMHTAIYSLYKQQQRCFFRKAWSDWCWFLIFPPSFLLPPGLSIYLLLLFHSLELPIYTTTLTSHLTACSEVVIQTTIKVGRKRVERREEQEEWREEERKKWLMREWEIRNGSREREKWIEWKGNRKRERMQFFSRGTSLRHFLLKEVSVEQCIICSCEWVSKTLRATTLFCGNMYA